MTHDDRLRMFVILQTLIGAGISMVRLPFYRQRGQR